MAEVEDTAAGPRWYGGLERATFYRRTNLIHEMSCGEVGSHLYSRMCCAGRSERAAALHLSPMVIGGGSAWEGLLMVDVNLFHASTQSTTSPQGQNSGRQLPLCHL